MDLTQLANLGEFIGGVAVLVSRDTLLVEEGTLMHFDCGGRNE